MDLIVVGTHEYQWALWPFTTLFRKYWGDEPLTYVGDRLEGPLPDGLDFVQVPGFAEGVWPWEHWFGKGLRDTLKEVCTTPVLALFLPDQWLVEPVDRGGVDALHRHMLDEPGVLRGNLERGSCLDEHGEWVAAAGKAHHIVSVPPSNPHCGGLGGSSMTPALWSRALLCALLEPGWDLWDCEGYGTEKMVGWYPVVRSVGTRPGLLKRWNGLLQSQPRAVSLAGMPMADRACVLDHLPPGWEVVT